MVAVDFIIIAIVAISIVVGYLRGFFPELVGVLTWIAAVMGGWHFSHLVLPYLDGKLASIVVETWAARLIVFVSILIVGGLVGQLLALVIDKTGLSGTDRILGLVFGLLRGGVIVGVLVIFAQLLGFPQESWWARSKLVPAGEAIASVIREMLPDAIDEHLDPDAPPDDATPLPAEG